MNNDLAYLHAVLAAAKNLVEQRGRYNTEIAYKKLEELIKRK